MRPEPSVHELGRQGDAHQSNLPVALLLIQRHMEVGELLANGASELLDRGHLLSLAAAHIHTNDGPTLGPGLEASIRCHER